MTCHRCQLQARVLEERDRENLYLKQQLAAAEEYKRTTEACIAQLTEAIDELVGTSMGRHRYRYRSEASRI